MRLYAVALTLLLALLIAPTGARAGTYDVYSCRLPDGSPAPTFGWQSFANSPGASSGTAAATDECATGGGMTASLPPMNFDLGTQAGWFFVAPANTVIEAFRVSRWASSPGAVMPYVFGYVASVDEWLPDSSGGDPIEECLSFVLPGQKRCDDSLGT
jgi:hypothetical protein